MAIRKIIKKGKKAAKRFAVGTDFRGNKKGKGVRKVKQVGIKGVGHIDIKTKDVRGAEDDFPQVKKRSPFIGKKSLNQKFGDKLERIKSGKRGTKKASRVMKKKKSKLDKVKSKLKGGASKVKGAAKRIGRGAKKVGRGIKKTATAPVRVQKRHSKAQAQKEIKDIERAFGTLDRYVEFNPKFKKRADFLRKEANR